MRLLSLSSFSIILVLMFSFLFCSSFAYVKPFWLKEGAYAYYHREYLSPLTFRNDTLVWGNVTYGWKCLGLTGKTAILEILIEISGKRLDPKESKTKPYDFAANYTISINVETREAFYGDEYLGFLPYWIPADVENLPYIDENRLPDWAPKIPWRVIENFTSYDNLTTYGLVGGVKPDIETPYKTFKGDELWSIVGAIDPLTGFTFIYEKDTGLWITKGLMDNFWRKIIGVDGSFDGLLKDTNIHFKPESTSPITILLPYIITVTAITATTASIYFIKIRRKKYSLTNTKR